jgi:hypothetical protein
MGNLRSHQLPRPQPCKQRTRCPINLGRFKPPISGFEVLLQPAANGSRRFVTSRVDQSRLYMLCQALCDLRSEVRRIRGVGTIN